MYIESWLEFDYKFKYLKDNNKQYNILIWNNINKSIPIRKELWRKVKNNNVISQQYPMMNTMSLKTIHLKGFRMNSKTTKHTWVEYRIAIHELAEKGRSIFKSMMMEMDKFHVITASRSWMIHLHWIEILQFLVNSIPIQILRWLIMVKLRKAQFRARRPIRVKVELNWLPWLSRPMINGKTFSDQKKRRQLWRSWQQTSLKL